METPQHFRTALNGFRREDVVQYLEYLNARHVTEVNQLTADAETLRKQVAELEEKLSHPDSPAAEPAPDSEDLQARLDTALSEKKTLEEMVAELEKAQAAPAADQSKALEAAETQVVSLKAKCQELEQKAADNQKIQDRCAQLEAELAALKAEKAAPQEKDLAQQELEAYRRAERAERIATEKADLIYHRANSVLDEASGKIDGASSELSELAERINAQLQQMQYSINSSKIALKSAVDTMHALHVDKT